MFLSLIFKANNTRIGLNFIYNTKVLLGFKRRKTGYKSAL